jgi:AhpC/TSA family
MKTFIAVAALTILSAGPLARAQQSPLAPPVIPKATVTGMSTTLKVGDKAPDFALPNGDGKLVVLSEYTQRSPVLLVFYRGFW